MKSLCSPISKGCVALVAGERPFVGMTERMSLKISETHKRSIAQVTSERLLAQMSANVNLKMTDVDRCVLTMWTTMQHHEPMDLHACMTDDDGILNDSTAILQLHMSPF